MGTVGADAAIPFQIASKAYVDGQTKINVNNEEQDVAQIVADLIGNGEGSVDDKISDAIDDALGNDFGDNGYSDVTAALADKADQSEIGDLDDLTTTADGSIVAAINELDAALDGKVNDSDKATSIGSTSTASDDKWATEAAVAAAIAGVNGGIGNVSQQIADALGGTYDSTNGTVTDALNDKLDKSATSNAIPAASSAVATNYANELAVANALAAKASATDLSTLDGQINGNGGLADTVGDANGGLVKQVADLETLVGDGTTSGIAKDVDDLQETVGNGTLANGFSNGVDNLTEAVNDLMANKADADDVYTKSEVYTKTEMGQLLGAKLEKPANNTCTAESQHCVLHMTMVNNEPVLSWVDVTSPFEVVDSNSGDNQTTP